MGKSIQKKWFGQASVPGNQIVVNGVKWADGTTSSNAYIVKQTGSAAYVVSNGTKSEIAFMVNATNTAGLKAGQCFILATPFGGSAKPCKKIAQYRLSVYESNGTIGNYSWSTIPATKIGQADLITGSGSVGSVLSISVTDVGFGYFTAPTVTFTGGGNGASATASIANGVVTGIVVNAGGTGYANGGITLGAPTTSVAATATATETGGVIDTITLGVAGGYYTSAPTVTVTGATAGAGADISAIITNGAVTGFTVNNGGSGYDAPLTVIISAPPADEQATATATISV